MRGIKGDEKMIEIEEGKPDLKRVVLKHLLASIIPIVEAILVFGVMMPDLMASCPYPPPTWYFIFYYLVFAIPFYYFGLAVLDPDGGGGSCGEGGMTG